MAGDRRSRGTVVVLAWLGAAVLTGAVAWNAVAVLSDDSPRTGVMSEEEVAAALTSARAAATTAPTSSATSTPTEEPTSESPTEEPTATEEPSTDPTSSAPSHTATATTPPTSAPSTSTPTTPPPAAVAATWHVTGGTVSVECRASSITLLYATPDNGWTVEIGSRGPEKVEVELHRSEQETKLVATCSGGTPTKSVTTEGDGESTEDD
ncbi:hypothetical protein OEB99_02010 [Actinotalea sp. M2MS4P-6]|uniref:hypothetical protein n=1 Tax=Actinotalea sp. M2MS4P-6 TaxID=2983762 RepID=UPI0021E3C2DB|nr:hypothetical protein [Actinotalea sp. M2MS4P-6]MCV2393072.1 hypothetical protein [Actinotalea sp. M2MS4P-6]